ncbi:MAG: hypothetical protein ACI9RM_000907 [Ulvibacter sp.]
MLQKIKAEGGLEGFEYFKGWKLLLVDGVHHFSSQKVQCDTCQAMHHQDGTITYNHSMLASVIAHPDKKEVIPLCEESVINQDGQTKNDCELNAVKRLHNKVKTRHSLDRFIYVEDALFANGPHIRDIESQNNRYIIRAKPSSGAGSVFLQYEALIDTGQVLKKEASKQKKIFEPYGFHKPSKEPPEINEVSTVEKTTIKRWLFVNGLYLNEANPYIEVNFLRYEERSVSSGKILPFYSMKGIYKAIIFGLKPEFQKLDSG